MHIKTSLLQCKALHEHIINYSLGVFFVTLLCVEELEMKLRLGEGWKTMMCKCQGADEQQLRAACLLSAQRFMQHSLSVWSFEI